MCNRIHLLEKLLNIKTPSETNRLLKNPTNDDQEILIKCAFNTVQKICGVCADADFFSFFHTKFKLDFGFIYACDFESERRNPKG